MNRPDEPQLRPADGVVDDRSLGPAVVFVLTLALWPSASPLVPGESTLYPLALNCPIRSSQGRGIHAGFAVVGEALSTDIGAGRRGVQRSGRFVLEGGTR